MSIEAVFDQMSPAQAQAAAAIEMQRTMKLTPRWSELRYHEQQALYYWNNVRFNVVPPGRRSGKTENAKRKVAKELTRRRKWPARLGYGAPTFGQAYDIYWQDLCDLIPRHWVADINKSRMEITTKWGALVRVIGFDRPRRIEGVIWDRLFIDEIADCPPGCVARNIRPALATVGREGGADFLGVPDEVGRNQAEYEELFNIGCNWRPELKNLSQEDLKRLNADPEIASYWWPSSDILDPKEIAAMERSMDHLSVMQELGGRFVTSGGKAVPRFDQLLHVDETYCTYHHALPIDWTLDFGTAPAASLIGQAFRGQVWIMDEIVLNDSSTDVATAEFLSRFSRHGYDAWRGIRVFGDAAGHSPHSNVGTTDYEILEKALRHAGLINRVEWRQLSHNPLVKDTLNAVRACVCTADNIIHLFIHPRCHNLIKDLKMATWPDESNKLRQFHCLAALRYYLYELFGDQDGYSSGGLLLPNLVGKK